MYKSAQNTHFRIFVLKLELKGERFHNNDRHHAIQPRNPTVNLYTWQSYIKKVTIIVHWSRPWFFVASEFHKYINKNINKYIINE